MGTIHFKNGEKKEISQKMAKILNDRIIEGCKDWQCFSDKDQPFLIVNLTEVTFID